MAIQVSAPPPRPVWDCHICGTPAAFTGHPDHCCTVPQPDGTYTHGLYHDDGTLCRWSSTDTFGMENVRPLPPDTFPWRS